MICDIQADTFYVEMQPASQTIDILGFLTRAWMYKSWHFFQGLPTCITVSKSLMKDKIVRNDIGFVCSNLDITFTYPSFPPWYAHMIGRFERALNNVYSIYWKRLDKECDISEIENIDALTCLYATLPDLDFWQSKNFKCQRPSVPEEWIRQVDNKYESVGSWRLRLQKNLPEFKSIINTYNYHSLSDINNVVDKSY
ncbi:MAG: hypothetical protein QM504_16945 [Pseudomonadota bacterium]